MIQKELKKCVVAGRIPKIRILTNVIGKFVGLKGIWQQIVKDVLY